MARSSREELTQGSFEEVLSDPAAPDPAKVRRLLLCTGKVAIDLMARRNEAKIEEAAVVRLEQLYPFPHASLDAEIAKYPNAEIYWVQEEPDNMGAWTFVFQRLQHHDCKIELVSRRGSGSPAVGSKTIHVQEQEELMDAAFEGLS